MLARPFATVRFGSWSDRVEKDLQSDIFWYATELGPLRYVELAKEALSDTRAQIRDTFGSSARLMDADITTMLISFEQAAMAAIRHLDSAANMRNEKLEDASYPDGEASTTSVREKPIMNWPSLAASS